MSVKTGASMRYRYVLYMLHGNCTIMFEALPRSRLQHLYFSAGGRYRSKLLSIGPLGKAGVAHSANSRAYHDCSFHFSTPWHLQLFQASFVLPRGCDFGQGHHRKPRPKPLP